MTTRDVARALVEQIGIIPSIRTSSAEDARFATETVAEAGIPIVEITMTVPQALGIISDLARRMPQLIVGAGTVLDLATARRCVDAGASFITSPGLDLPIVEFTLSGGVLAIPGALTPTEVTAAWRTGADFIKVFPCAQVGGAGYILALKAPFPDGRFVAAGGVSLQTAAEFISAGAAAIGVGTELIPKRAMQQRDAHWITELTRRFLSIVQEAREQIPGRSEILDRR
jgi:2-dehydro-3-deoxyphosphogluconate aldolase/(4S)-4-hydroxy-2-oxoglutarate aldolase